MLRKTSGFTLIELLIVVTIIAILAAIAVPNFLEAQVRAKISRSKADMRSISTAIEAYRVDSNKLPLAMLPPYPGYDPPSWWGFCSTGLTTPIAYMTALPAMAFTDEVVSGIWASEYDGSQNNQPYTYVYDTGWQYDQRLLPDGTAPGGWEYQRADAGNYYDRVAQASYIIYTCGPDGADGLVNTYPMHYDPTNGSISFGDIFHWGSGSQDSTVVSGNRSPN